MSDGMGNSSKIRETVKNEKGVWYKVFITECVLCGKGDTIKERQPGPKPLDYNEVYHYQQFVCGYHYL